MAVVGHRQQKTEMLATLHFLINTFVDDASAAPIPLLMNWQPEAKK